MDHEAEGADIIRQQMQETRVALADKLETLEQHVLGTVEDTRAAVTETAAKVSEAVEGTVDTVKDTVESVRQTFDLRLQVERHPWMMLGGSVAAGYLMGRLLSMSPAAAGNGAFAATAAATAPVGVANVPHTAAPPKHSYVDALAPELEKVKALALGAVLGLVRDLVSQSLPSALEEPVREVMDRMTDKLGGRPIQEPILADAPRHH